MKKQSFTQQWKRVLSLVDRTLMGMPKVIRETKAEKPAFMWLSMTFKLYARDMEKAHRLGMAIQSQLKSQGMGEDFLFHFNGLLMDLCDAEEVFRALAYEADEGRDLKIRISQDALEYGHDCLKSCSITPIQFPRRTK